MRVAVVLVLVLVLVLVHVWSITSSNEERSGQCIESERQALLGFKKGLVDRDNRLSSWTSSRRDCCTWEGIRCDNLTQTHHIVVLNLRTNDLDGEIGPSLIELKQLRHLDLSSNSFTIIPKFIGSLTRLRYLDLRYNPFIGAIPSHLGNLTRLHSLYLGSLEGQLKADNLKWLSRLTSLRDYSLSRIDLSKAIDWFQSIKAAPSLLSLTLEFCQLPQVDLLSPSNKNSSDSLTNLEVFDSSIHPTTVPWLFNVSINLVNLTLYYSNDGGPIPNSFENMRNLENIYLRGNGFEGEIPNSLRNLCTLKQLSLIGNIFNTTLHDFLEWLSGGCTKDSLEILDLSSNQLRGSIPEMNSFPIFLRELRIRDNLLKGPLPSLSKLPYLRELDVSSNSLSGLISEVHFHNLSNLEILRLSSNSLAIKFNSTWIPPFQLTSIWLSSCKSGPKFPSWLKTQVNINYLDLSHNEIKDTIPMNWFSNLTTKLYYLDLSFNQFHGHFSLYNMTSPMFQLDLSSNQFHGPFSLYNVTAPMYYLDLSSNRFHGPIRLHNFTSETRFLNLSFNQFSGPIPSSLSSNELYLQNNKLTSLTSFLCEPRLVVHHKIYVLDLSNNLLSGSLPECWGNLNDLAILNLGHNNLSGVIPKSMGLLLQIRVLQLRHNNFSGNLPSSLQTCEQLQVFDIGDNALEGKIPLWIGQKLTNLIFLSVKSNQLSNRIPSNLCNLHAIEMLDLSMNRIFGTIPPCLDNFTSMVEKRDDHELDTGSYIFSVDVPLGENTILPFELVSLVIMWKGVYLENEKIFRSLRLIDLSSNQLTGQIPEELTHLVELIQLNLSWNNLHGAIPKEVGKLSNLQSLDLSNNKLSGEIPSSLATISFLSYLKLSNNRLSGKIPTGTQLQSFEASSYTGNLRLCGPPLPKSCFGDETLQGNPNSNRDESIVEDSDKWFDMKQFHMGIGVGFIIGFIGVCANILLIKSWRIAYFQFLNSMENWLYVTISIKMAQLKRMFSN